MSYSTSNFFQDADSEECWEKLLEELDPSKLNDDVIIPQIKAKILAFKAQVILVFSCAFIYVIPEQFHI